MEDSDDPKEVNFQTRSFALDRFRPQSGEEGFDLLPLDVAGDRAGKDERERLGVFAFHVPTVPYFSTMSTAI